MGYKQQLYCFTENLLKINDVMFSVVGYEFMTIYHFLNLVTDTGPKELVIKLTLNILVNFTYK